MTVLEIHAPERAIDAAVRRIENPDTWLLLRYRVAAVSRHRVHVWRQLKNVGGLVLQPGIVAAPDVAYAHDALSALVLHIRATGGEAQLIRCDVLDGNGDIVDEYNAARNNEYEGVQARSERLFARIASSSMPASKSLLQQWRREMQRIARLMKEAERHDTLGAEGFILARSAVANCRAALQRACDVGAGHSQATRAS